eukprot:Pgem_evm1s5467
MSCYYDKIQDLLPKYLFDGDSPIFTAPKHYEDHMNIIGDKVANDLLVFYGDDNTPGKIVVPEDEREFVKQEIVSAVKTEISSLSNVQRPTEFYENLCKDMLKHLPRKMPAR